MIIINANPTIIVEIKIPPKLIALTPDSQRLTWSLWHSDRFIFGLLNSIKTRHGFPPKIFPWINSTPSCRSRFTGTASLFTSIRRLLPALLWSGGARCFFLHAWFPPTGGLFFHPSPLFFLSMKFFPTLLFSRTRLWFSGKRGGGAWNKNQAHEERHDNDADSRHYSSFPL